MAGGIVAFVLNLMHAGWWWAGEESSVPRDGRSHVVTIDQPSGDYVIWSDRSLVDPTCSISDQRGGDVALHRVPPDQRLYVGMLAVAEPEASFRFTVPASDTLTITCDEVDATPVQTLGIGPAPSAPLFTSWPGGRSSSAR